jgi:transketolase
VDRKQLKDISKKVRIDVVRMIHAARCGNIGGCLSCVEIMVYLYYCFLKRKLEEPDWEDRDRFILSKGQASPTLYSILATLGYFPERELLSFRSIGSRLQTHPQYGSLPGIEFPSGSLGQGLSAGLGMALGFIHQQLRNRVIVLLGDGELQEGQVWEAAMAASHYQLNNLIAVVDNNRLQDNGLVEETIGIEPLASKWESYGWSVNHCNGHDFDSIDKAMRNIDSTGLTPSAILCRTVKGKGISFMEGSPDWHMINNMSEDVLRKSIWEIVNG